MGATMEGILSAAFAPIGVHLVSKPTVLIAEELSPATVEALGPWIYTVRVLHGFAEAMLFTALFTYAADHVPRSRRTQGLAFFGVSGILPMALGGIIGGAIGGGIIAAKKVSQPSEDEIGLGEV